MPKVDPVVSLQIILSLCFLLAIVFTL